MKVVVIGLGYLGATHAACMAELGHDVLGVELDQRKREMLSLGEVPFFEPHLPRLLARHVESGRLRVTDSYTDAADFSDVFFVAVGTPQKKGEYSADLQFVESALDKLVPLLSRDALIIGKSTVPVGTSRDLAKRVQSLNEQIRVEIAWNPEFLREGFAVQDTLEPDRIVLGKCLDGRAEGVIRELYSAILARGIPFIVTDPSTAELVKTAANAFLATKISFINAIAEICEAADADIQAVADAIGYDDRIGRKFLNAGLGFGGGCLPKDIRAFMARAGELGAAEALSFLREVDNVNMRRRTRMVDLARIVCGGTLLGKTIAVLGAAFKPNSDDVRDSPALNVAGQIQLHGANVSVYDPKAMQNSARLFPTLQFSDSPEAACQNADLVMVLTEWQEFVDLQPGALDSLVRERKIIDGRMCMDRQRWSSAGWSYYA